MLPCDLGGKANRAQLPSLEVAELEVDISQPWPPQLCYPVHESRRESYLLESLNLGFQPLGDREGKNE